ncbi:anhydro-N-acetylmuramic acid kinase [Lewinellaceae bacterium SD302]|nr:anhydro-N-acetylmuramic acid kinase [Lewinellaceae bacterium SD302]
MPVASREKMVIGLMSGSSMDGLDLALCRFKYQDDPAYKLDEWEIVAGTTLPYPQPWKARLRLAIHLPGRELWRLHADLGKYFGRAVARWCKTSGHEAELLGSHGHTLFHAPEKGFTTQLGDGAQIAYFSGLPTVSELRASDLAAGGQGAPIAPLADLLLFPGHQAFVNLGGIANISLKADENILAAGDVSGANQVLDHFASELGLSYDEGGGIARSGQLLSELLTSIEKVPYHDLSYPKSLDNGWVRDELLPVLVAAEGSVKDKMHTFCQFLAQQIHGDIVRACEKAKLSPQPIKVLVTGGGVHNHFLLDCLRAQAQDEQFPLGYEAASPQLADLKEAALVALCALHRELGVVNVLSGATGAKRDTVNGALYLP